MNKKRYSIKNSKKVLTLGLCLSLMTMSFVCNERTNSPTSPVETYHSGIDLDSSVWNDNNIAITDTTNVKDTTIIIDTAVVMNTTAAVNITDTTIRKGTVHFDDTQCLSCHLSWPKSGIKVNLTDFKYAGDFILLCTSCHKDKHIENGHPTEAYKITCQDCHNACFLNRFEQYLLRGINGNYQMLCLKCHPQQQINMPRGHI